MLEHRVPQEGQGFWFPKWGSGRGREQDFPVSRLMINPRALPVAGLEYKGIRSLSAPVGAPGDIAYGATLIPHGQPSSSPWHNAGMQVS